MRKRSSLVALAAVVGLGVAAAIAQQPSPPPFATTKVTDNVYLFR